MEQPLTVVPAARDDDLADDQFVLTLSRAGTRARVTVSGRMSQYDVAHVVEAVHLAGRDGVDDVRVDLRRVRHFDDTALGSLRAAREALVARDVAVTVLAPRWAAATATIRLVPSDTDGRR